MSKPQIFLLVRITFVENDYIALSASPQGVLPPKSLDALLETVGQMAGRHDPDDPKFSHAAVWRDLKKLHPHLDFIVEANGDSFTIPAVFN